MFIAQLVVFLSAGQRIRQQHQVPFLIIYYEYTRLKQNVLSDSLIRVENGKYYDILPRAQSPYENKVLFISAPVKEKIYQGEQTFLISRDYYVSNLPDPTSIQIDFDDGQGYRSVSFGQTINVTYVNNEIRNIKQSIKG